MDPTDRWRFEDYEIDLGTGELQRRGQPVPLQRQPARVLARLVGRAGALVPREELHAAVRGDGVYVDFDRGLNYCIRQLRQALGDDPRAPRFIETVARQGYRFVAPIEPAAPTRPETASTARSARHRRWQVAAAALGALTLGLAVDRMAGGNPEHHEIAVTVVQALHDIVF
jgi:DNA-binding winged helix-turn-helix (wHTH) protein